LVPLLAAAIFINYVDRGNLSTAAPLLQDELHLSNAQIGLLSSAFFWVYAPAQLVAAWLVQRINPYRALALGLAVWSLATTLSGFAVGFGMLLALRILLGVGESVGFPASSKLLSLYLPQHRLGSANALISAGISLGPAVGTFLGGMLIAQAGWRALFIAFGIVSLAWLLPWWLATRSLSTEIASVARAPEPGYAELLSKRELWGAAFGHFANNYAFYLILSWLPLYLVKAHGYSLTSMAKMGGLVYVLSAAIGLIAGAYADKAVASGADPNRVRKGTMCSGIVIGLIGLLACGLGSPPLAVAGLLIYAGFHGLSSFNNFAIGQTLAGPRATAKWIGVQNCVANFSGIVAPVVTGFIVDKTGHFSLAFLVAAAVLVLGFISWGIVIRRVEPIEWRPASSL
jgi:MFS family permease